MTSDVLFARSAAPPQSASSGGLATAPPSRFANHDELIKFCVERLHTDRAEESARAIAEFSGQKARALNESQAEQLNFSLLQWCLDNDRYFDAALLCWPKTIFNPEPHSTREIWKLFEESNQFMLQGAASMGKSYSIGARLILEWVRDPVYTTIKVLGPSEAHLQDNLFSHLVDMHRNSAVKLPGKIGRFFIGTDERSRRGAIIGVVVSIGKKSASKIKGVKRFPRAIPHPKLGALSRFIVFMDEMNEIPPGIWKDVDNVLAASTKDGSFKIGGAFNPHDESDNVGVRCEPEWGWSAFDMDQHFKWKSKRGWDVLRLDALKCENIIQGKEIYPGLQTKEGMEIAILNAGGTSSPGYYSMVRAAFPPKGADFSIIPQGLLHVIKAEVLWIAAAKPFAGADLALEGGDNAIFARGDFGLARGLRFPPSLEYPNGQEFVFMLDAKPSPHMVLQLTQLYLIPKGDTVQVARPIKDLCQKIGIRPEYLCVDRTGNGAGVHDHLKQYWSPLVRGVNYFEGATEKKIMEEDQTTPKESMERMVSELWFAMSKWIEFKYFVIAPHVDSDKLFPQLSGRMFRPGPKSKVESKKDYKSRGNTSPNEADAVSLLVHAARMESDVPSMGLAKGDFKNGGFSNEDAPYWHVSVTDTYDNDL